MKFITISYNQLKVKKIIFLIFFIASIIFSWSVCYDFEGAITVLLIPFLILLVTLVPFFLSKIFIFSPWAYLLYFTFLNVFLRSFCILLDYPSKMVIDDIFLQGQEKAELLYPAFIVFVGYMIITGVFVFLNRCHFDLKIKMRRLDEWDKKKLIQISIFVLIVSAVCFYNFIIVSISKLSLLDIANFSNYRGVSTELSDYRANGYLRFGIQLSELILYTNYIYIITNRVNNSYVFYFFIILALILSLSFYVFVQSRSGLLMVFINLLIFRYIFVRNKISKFAIVFTSLFLLSIFGFLTSIRGGSGFKAESFSITYPLQALEPFIVNNGGIDISKTGKIMDYVNKNNDFKYGSSLTWNFIAWIPRSLWKDKPVNIDTEVGLKVYGATAFGTGAVPPGLFGEMYWNFAYLGIFFGCIFVGFILSIVQKYFNGRLASVNSTMIYIICFSQMSVGILGSSLTSTLTGILFTLLPILGINKWVLKKSFD